MQSVRQICLAAALLVLVPAAAGAEGFIAPFIGFNYGGDSANCFSLQNCDEKRTNFGLVVGARHGIFGVEEDIGYAPDFFGKTEGGHNAVLTAMSSFLVAVPAGPVQPYGIVGVGLIRPHFQLNSSSLSLSQNAFGYDIGAGVNLYLFGKAGIRGDVRHIKTLDNLSFGFFSKEKLDFWRASAGLVIRF